MAADLRCADCGASMVLRSGRWGLYYGCTRWPNCGGSHGAHPDGSPMGTPGTAALRAARRQAHAAFDPLWRGGAMSRGDAYRWLAHALGQRAVHIGELDEAGCARVVAAVQARHVEQHTEAR